MLRKVDLAILDKKRRDFYIDLSIHIEDGLDWMFSDFVWRFVQHQIKAENAKENGIASIYPSYVML